MPRMTGMRHYHPFPPGLRNYKGRVTNRSHVPHHPTISLHKLISTLRQPFCSSFGSSTINNMQFTTIVVSAFMAASAIAAPALEARQATVIGTIDLFSQTGCNPRFQPSVPGFNLTVTPCSTFPAGTIAGNVTSIVSGFKGMIVLSRPLQPPHYVSRSQS